jgi:hypothetical protein
MNTGITLITMAQGNPIVLKETLKSFEGIADEIIFGDVLLFNDDRELIQSYCNEFNLKIIKYPFNYIFQNGFSAILNDLISHSSNDWNIYMNCSEIISKGKESIVETVQVNSICNTFYFNHDTDSHHWYRLNRKSELHWAGNIHEQCGPEELFRPFHKPLFTMADLNKDNDNAFKARCYDFAKECCYFHNYKKLIDHPQQLGFTDGGWLKFARDNYDSFTERLENKGDFYRAFLEGDLEMLMRYANKNPAFEKERLQSSIVLEYQNDPQFLGK